MYVSVSCCLKVSAFLYVCLSLHSAFFFPYRTRFLVVCMSYHLTRALALYTSHMRAMRWTLLIASYDLNRSSCSLATFFVTHSS
ncbi:hypothetical protein F5I97DRAFT_682792 [Phlebopus sp. FC_14]|nr:hypothetical protein F5I97DRAFT_682792 [Phlebopus sp. FC_14]